MLTIANFSDTLLCDSLVLLYRLLLVVLSVIWLVTSIKNRLKKRGMTKPPKPQGEQIAKLTNAVFKLEKQAAISAEGGGEEAAADTDDEEEAEADSDDEDFGDNNDHDNDIDVHVPRVPSSWYVLPDGSYSEGQLLEK